jgi:hypothetical protein
LIKALFSRFNGNIFIDYSNTSLGVGPYFSYFLFPINEISVSDAASNCSGAVTKCEVVTISPLRHLFLGLNTIS